MITENQKKRLRYKMKNPLRMVIFNDQNLHTLGQFRFTPQSLFMLIASVVIFLIVGVILLIARLTRINDPYEFFAQSHCAKCLDGRFTGK